MLELKKQQQIEDFKMMHNYTKAELQKEIDWKQKFMSFDLDMKQRND